MTGIDHCLPPIQAQRSKAFDKKSRSTTSWPILACSFVSSASRFCSRALPFSSKTWASFSTASRFQAAIWVGCKPCLVASSATVAWPLSASSATFALNSAENRLRVLMMDRPLHRRIHLSRLSQEVGPLLYQTVPIFAYFLGYFILGETITAIQGVGSFVIIMGALALSFEFGHRRRWFKRKVVGLMLAASFLNAVNGVIFKLIAVDKGFWLSLFWGFVGQVIVGLIFFVCVPRYRKNFFDVIKELKITVLALISLSEALFTVAEGITLYATLLAPVALVLLVNSFQPLFVFVLGILLTLFFPRLGRESLGATKMLQKVLGISLLLAGGYLIST